MTISCDGIFCHGAFAEKLGGISFPMLSDYHPKGEVSTLYGVYGERGASLRSVFLIDSQGVLRWKKIYEQGLPEVSELLSELDKIS